MAQNSSSTGRADCSRIAEGDNGCIRGIEAGEHKRSARIAVSFRIHLHAPEISAPALGVLALIPDRIVGKGVGLVSREARSRVLKTGEVCTGQVRQAPAERILGNSRDCERSRNIVAESAASPFLSFRDQYEVLRRLSVERAQDRHASLLAETRYLLGIHMSPASACSQSRSECHLPARTLRAVDNRFC